MTVVEVQTMLLKHQADLTAFGVKQLHLFGSTARGQATEQSDLDFLVELKEYSLHNFMGLKFALEEWFAKPVDLATIKQLKPTVLEQVKKDLQRVA
jgi:uncharacterized protein